MNNKLFWILPFCFSLIVVSSCYAQNSSQKTDSRIRTISAFFPDTSLGLLVAERLNKKLEDKVSTYELTGIKGSFVVGPGNVSNLKGIGYLIGVDTFSCYKNEVIDIPAEIGNMTNLKYLDLCKAFKLKKIPSTIKKLKNLQMLRLCLTQVTHLPKEIGDLENLTTLWICSNELVEIPYQIGQLRKLTDLDLHANSLKVIPDQICNLVSLQKLNISHCGLEKLPGNIGNLKKLTSLNLFNNKLKVLPKSIAHLDNLVDLNVYDNFNLSENYKAYLPKRYRSR